MTRSDRFALLLSVLTVFVAYLVADRIFERMSHLEDEMTYVWQAQAIAGGDLVLPSPPSSESFLTPFVVDYNGVRFGKYPPGWPVVLSMGVLAGLRSWVNPLLAGAGIWLLYLLARRITSASTGLLAAVLMITSPMFWMLSGSLLSHAWSLVVALGFMLAWLDTFPSRKPGAANLSEHKAEKKFPSWLTMLTAGLSLGVLVLTRPVTAVGVGLPFFVHGLVLLVCGDRQTRIRVLAVGLLALSVGLLLFAWQYAVTGDPLLNPYTLWWEYDRYGFGEGFGRVDGGHTLKQAWQNARYSLRANGAGGDLLGWKGLWWLFLPFGLWAARRKPAGWLAAGIFPALVLVYLPYWIGSWQYGPRYYFEGLISLTIVSAAGIAWLAGNSMRLRKVLAGVALVVLAGSNLLFYLPNRLQDMQGLSGINRTMLEPFLTSEAQALTPALVIVHTQGEWADYGGLLELQNAQLSTSFIFSLTRGVIADDALARAFQGRQVIHYYPDDPYQFYATPRELLTP